MLKAGGGLNLTNMKLWNRAAIAKTCWVWHTNRTSYRFNGSTHTTSKGNSSPTWQLHNKLAGWLGKFLMPGKY